MSIDRYVEILTVVFLTLFLVFIGFFTVVILVAAIWDLVSILT